MKVLFIGESWLGSCSRSIREALSRIEGIHLDEIAEDAYFPKARSRYLRAIGRVLYPLYRRDFNQQVLAKIRVTKPDVVIVYKGSSVRSDLAFDIKRLGPLLVNIYPDCSPHAHGKAHRNAVSAYDLVISTKAYHPNLWLDLYKYHNECFFVPQGYDPLLHLIDYPPTDFKFDVVIVATYRHEYGQLLIDLASKLIDKNINFAIGGYGWEAIKHKLPSHWVYTGPIQGRGYISLLRSGKICIAPLTRDVVINGRIQPGDVDTTRTYELAAAHCFFIHRRTEFVSGLYGDVEVPMFDDASELASKINYYLNNEDERKSIALSAHQKAVPAYSNDSRAAEIISILQSKLNEIKLNA